MTKDRKLLRAGSLGAAIAAICCFTPALVILVGFAGLSAIVGWLDYALFPILFASMGLVAYALYLRSGLRAGRTGPSPTAAIVATVVALSALLFWLEFRYALRIAVTAAVAVAVYAYYLRACDRRRSSRPADAKETTS